MRDKLMMRPQQVTCTIVNVDAPCVVCRVTVAPSDDDAPEKRARAAESGNVR
jgi:hypothetical protein